MEHMGITHRRITPRWPRANALAESLNKPLMESVRSANIHQLNWKQEMFKFFRQYGCTPHVTTGQTPHKLLFGREPKAILPMVPAHTMDPHIDEKIWVNDSEAKYKVKCYADARNCADYRDIKVGDSVVMNINENYSQSMKDQKY